MRQKIDVLQGLLENPPPSDSPHNIIVCGDDQDAVTDAKQLTDCQPGFKVGSHCLAL
jgi:predicted dinucleotide-binding enzyme